MMKQFYTFDWSPITKRLCFFSWRSACRLLGAIAFGALLIGGGQGAINAQTPQAPTNDGPPTAQYVTSTYMAMKKVFQRYYDQGKLSQNIYKHRLTGQSYFYQMSSECGNAPADNIIGLYDPATSGPDPSIAEIAANVVIWENDFRIIGYPERIWGPIIDGYAKAGLNDIANPPDDDAVEIDWQARLITALNRDRHKNNPSLPRLADASPGCGGGDNLLNVASDPKGARIYFTMMFYYELCKVKGIDPLDVNKCANWQEVDDAGADMVSGMYYYLVKWPDGSIKSGPIDADKMYFKLSYTSAVFHKVQTQSVTFHK